MPYSMLGAPEEEVTKKTRNLLQLLGSYSQIGPQVDGNIIECEVAPQREMATAMAIANVMQTLGKNPIQSPTPTVSAPKPDKGTSYPEIILKGASSEELSTGEILSCIQAQRNPNAKPNK